MGRTTNHAHVLEPALVGQSAAHGRIEIVAALLSGDRTGRLGDELPLGVRDPLVLVRLGPLILLLVEGLFQNWFDLRGGGGFGDLLVVALLAPSARGSRCFDRALQHSILLIFGDGPSTVHLGENCLGASVIPQVFVVVEHLGQSGLERGVDLGVR